MALQKPTIVLITSHALIRSMYERHTEHFAKVVCLPDIAEFERRSTRLHAAALIIDETALEAVTDIAKLRKRFSRSSLKIMLLCKSLEHTSVQSLHDAGVDDILVTTQLTPREIIARLQKSLNV